jgi:hypothetical protein
MGTCKKLWFTIVWGRIFGIEFETVLQVSEQCLRFWNRTPIQRAETFIRAEGKSRWGLHTASLLLVFSVTAWAAQAVSIFVIGIVKLDVAIWLDRWIFFWFFTFLKIVFLFLLFATDFFVVDVFFSWLCCYCFLYREAVINWPGVAL